jgi:hypothetical protein
MAGVPHKLHEFLMDLYMVGYRVGEVESGNGRNFEITKNGQFVAFVKGDRKGEPVRNNLLHRLNEAFQVDALLVDYVRGD